jgi:perosamine synthetase
MTNMQAAIGCAQLEKIDKFIEIKRSNALQYNSILKDCNKVITPPEKKWAKNSYWLYSILIKDGNTDYIVNTLKERNIDSRRFFYPINILPPYRQKGDFKVSSMLSKTGISLPSSVNLAPGEIKYIANSLMEILGIRNENIRSSS